MSPSKFKCSSPFGNLGSCSLLTLHLCSFSCFSYGYVICGASIICLATCTIVGTTNGATLPFIAFYTLASMLFCSLLILEPEVPPSSALFYLLKALLGVSTITFFLFYSVVYISSLVVFTLVNGFYGFSFWWTNRY
jgi:hypothetical protein